MNTWNILYRGSLSSCNYGCSYCPFAKTANTIDELTADQRELDQFSTWVEQQDDRRIGILITPWGEALVHRYYRETMNRISHYPNVYRIAIQTNLSAPVDEFSHANPASLGIWATYHPGEISLAKFLRRCRDLDILGLRYSVGIVGLREHFDAMESLRDQLHSDTYLWVNAYKRDPQYYHPDEVDRIRSIDPYFNWNRTYHPSQGKPCHAGNTSFTVDGNGDVRRCHFIDKIIGNIHEPNFRDHLKPSHCSNTTCGCHIGYVHRPEMRLDQLYRDGLLERIPATWPKVNSSFVNGEADSAVPTTNDVNLL